MKKLALFLVLTITLSCSKDDPCQEITALSAVQNSDGSFTYSIQIDRGETIITNKETVDFYRNAAAPDCFEGFK